jgi:hypothetical protein
MQFELMSSGSQAGRKPLGEGKGALSDEHKSYSVFDQEDRPASLKDVLDVAEKKKQICIERRLKFKKNEKQIVIRDLLDRVIGWVNRFKEVGGGDADLGSTVLPWSGIYVLLQVRILGLTTVMRVSDYCYLASYQRRANI